jgi:small subunit ribosomal protein S2
MPYVHHRWLGGLLTNFHTISARIKRLHELERYASEGQLALLPTRERMAAEADLAKLQANLGGVKDMTRVPDAVFVVDLNVEAIAIREARRLRIPVIGLVDTNCDPDGVDYVIPGNDDAIRSCSLITKALGDAISESASVWRAEQERLRQEAEERARKEAEERARREAEEAARKEAEEKAAQEAAAAEAAAQGEPPAKTEDAPVPPPAAAEPAPAAATAETPAPEAPAEAAPEPAQELPAEVPAVEAPAPESQPTETATAETPTPEEASS